LQEIRLEAFLELEKGENMCRTLLLVSMISLACLTHAQLLYHRNPDPNVPPTAVQLKRSVVSLELQCVDGNSFVTESGTGFLVAYNDSRLTQGRAFQYLATNRHVAECWDERGHPRRVRSLIIRANAVNGDSRRMPANPAEWHFPTDESVDLAVMPVLMPDGLQITLFPVETFATDDFIRTNAIAEGSPILLAGYFYQLPGERRLQSIVRQGILAMVPDEPVMTTTNHLGTVYLCDAHIFGGNSGSPVLATPDYLSFIDPAHKGC